MRPVLQQSIPMITYHPTYRPDIDGLRALAVLSVVIFHAAPTWLPGGFIGVDVFFVISGYLISLIILGNLDRGSFSFSEFYARRINRIFPALMLVLAACWLLGWLVLLADEYKLLGKHLAAGSGFISNVVLMKEAGYFDTLADTKPLLHLWSLGIEEQFYLIWPLLLWVAWKRKHSLLAWTLVVAMVSFYLNVRGVKKHPVLTFYMPQTRFWELLCGGLLAWLTLYGQTDRSATVKWLREQLATRRILVITRSGGHVLSNITSALGALLLIYGFWRIHPELKFPGRWALVPVTGAVLLIAAGPHAWVNKALLSHRVAIWFGLISFPLYLWHWPLLTFLRIVEGGTPGWGLRLAAVSVSIGLAWLTYRFIERPLRSGRRHRWQTAALVSMAAFIAVIGLATYHLDGLGQRKIAMQSKDFDYSGDVPGYVPCKLPQFRDDTSLTYCLEPAPGTPDAVLIGDSHAEDKFHGLVAVDKKHTWMLMGNASCPPTLGITIEGDQKNCELKFNAILKYIAQSNQIKQVVLSFYGHYFATSAYAADHVKANVGPQTIKVEAASMPQASRTEIFHAGIDAATKFLISHGKTVTLLIDMPELPFIPKDCSRSAFNRCEISRREALERQVDLRRIVDRLKASHPGLTVFDPIDLVCDDDRCGYTKADVVIYRDSHHLSKRGSVLYAQRFLASR